MTLEECQGRWRVTVLPSVEKVFRKRRLMEELRGRTRRLEEELSRDPETVWRLLEEPIVARRSGPVRRYRFRLGGVWWRLLFAVDASRCEVAFIAVDRRDEETYRRLRQRLR